MEFVERPWTIFELRCENGSEVETGFCFSKAHSERWAVDHVRKCFSSDKQKAEFLALLKLIVEIDICYFDFE